MNEGSDYFHNLFKVVAGSKSEKKSFLSFLTLRPFLPSVFFSSYFLFLIFWGPFMSDIGMSLNFHVPYLWQILTCCMCASCSTVSCPTCYHQGEQHAMPVAAEYSGGAQASFVVPSDFHT